MTPNELQNKVYTFSISYFLPDLRKDREAFYALTDEQLNAYPICKAGYILNLFMDGNFEKANKMINELPEHDTVRLGLTIVNPSVTWKDFANTMEYFKLTDSHMDLLVLTAGRPYLVNGYNDFCRLMPFLTKYKDYFINALDILYGKNCSKPIYNLLLAENLYQKNKLTDAEILLSQTITDFDKKNEYRFLFTSLYLNAKIFIAHRTSTRSEQFINDIENRVTHLGKAEFSNNINAVKAQFSLYECNYIQIYDWIKTDAPDEISDFNMLDLYRYMIKIRCYILMEQYNSAISLIEKLRPLLITGRRPTDLCELDLLLCITLYVSGKIELSMEALDRCLKIAKRRGFHRLIADEGIAVFKPLLEYVKLYGESDFLVPIIESTRQMAILYPRYLTPRYQNNEQFSQQEIDILNLIQQGKTQEEIAEYFFISVNTVKYHLKKIYSKLDAQNATKAVWNAKLLGLIN